MSRAKGARETAATGAYGLLLLLMSPAIVVGAALFGVCWLLGCALHACGVTKEMVEM